ncbi:hypothetical protein NDU88_004244 [Pleurodeles waltl]|uniref:Uncharacterized protein n=1 Tax=Pleurodeles waltl TaxID=8319 RepID=A0AAV7TQQ9_PLEWA|nr:hypothetical protein NDU88_004244 [Pleurodeles waltl]
MAAATGERAPAFSSEELEKLVDGVLPQCAQLYGPPDQQHHQAEEIWRRSRRELQVTRPRWALTQTPRARVIRRARGAPQRGPVETPATRTRPRLGAP